jgi:L-aspartate oxidase
LLEGLVFGARAGAAAYEDCYELPSAAIHLSQLPGIFENETGEVATAVRKRVKKVMWDRVGIARERDGLRRAVREFEQISGAKLGTSSRNFVTVAKLVAQAALWREESRGGHYRTDFPDRNDEHWQIHSIQKMDSEITSSKSINFQRSVK